MNVQPVGGSSILQKLDTNDRDIKAPGQALISQLKCNKRIHQVDNLAFREYW